MKKYYVSTPIFYVNDRPHVGHAYTTIAADILARFYRNKIGKDNVFFLVGTDEHGQKIAQSAEEQKVLPKDFVDLVVPEFKSAWKLLDIDYDFFMRTTDPRHEKIVTNLLQQIYNSGFIYEGLYKGLYCVGCEKFLVESELVDERCPFHPNKKPVYQEEKNYFLKLKDLSKKVLKKIEDGDYKIYPKSKENEVVKRIKQGVDDISISRAGVSWGIPLPWDKSQTIYVWVDALINYYSATKFLKNKSRFWPADLHIVGKDILWFHAVIWEALLTAANLKIPKHIFAHGFFTIDGQKMSKSLGNVISPNDLVNKYGVDGARYVVISAYPFGSDGDVSIKRFDEKYNSDLANGLGNLISRVSKLCEQKNFNLSGKNDGDIDKNVSKFIKQYKFEKALDFIFAKVEKLNLLINVKKPWDLDDKSAQPILSELVKGLLAISTDLEPFLPTTSSKIKSQFYSKKIKAISPIFPRI